MRAVDTNLLVRLVARDAPKQMAAASRAISSCLSVSSAKLSRIFSVTGVGALVGDDFVSFILLLARQVRGPANCIRIRLNVLACTACITNQVDVPD